MRRAARIAAGALSFITAGLLLAFVQPRATGVTWDASSDQLAGLPVWQLLELTLVWAAGLWVHTYVLRGALPGLSRRRAVALNLGGSSVSNVLPLGGAAGIGLNYAMLRSWGYSAGQITTFTTVSNFVVAVVKIALAVVGIAALVGAPPLDVGFSPHLVSSGGLTVVLVAVAALVVCLVGLASFARPQLWARAAAATARLRRQCAQILRRGWKDFTFGGLGYPALQLVLLWSCLGAFHAAVSIQAVAAAYTTERLLTLLPLTPGGVGFVETAAIAVLTAFGADAAAAAAGVILFRIFTYVIEIPLGAVVTATWFARRGRAASARSGP